MAADFQTRMLIVEDLLVDYARSVHEANAWLAEWRARQVYQIPPTPGDRTEASAGDRLS